MAARTKGDDIYNPVSGRVSGVYMTSEDGTEKVTAMKWFGEDNKEFTDKCRSWMHQYKWRDQDFLLTAYPKTGTHMMWEIAMMLLNGSCDYIGQVKEKCMIDLLVWWDVDKHIPSDRVLNTHFTFKILPKQYHNRKHILVLRNPKDTAVSCFYFLKKLISMYGRSEEEKIWSEQLTFSEYLKIFLFDKEQLYGSYFDYVEYMWTKAKNNPNSLIVYYEDVVREPVAQLQKMNDFMNTNRSADLIQQIADATSFKTMKNGKSPVCLPNMSEAIFRKGGIGDWKNHMTVAENEMFDSVLKQSTAGKDIHFTYE